MPRDTAVVLAAGGLGRRFGALKQFLCLANRPIIEYSLAAFAAVEDVGEVVLVLPESHLEEGRRVVDAWCEAASTSVVVHVEEGGRRRQDSVFRGLQSLRTEPSYVLVHDAARPRIRPAEIAGVLAACREGGSAVLGTACSDSFKRVVDGVIVDEVDRDELWAVQTPQAAAVDILLDAYKRHGEEDWTDESSLLRAAGARPIPVEGSRENIKITSPGDEQLAEAILRSRG